MEYTLINNPIFWSCASLGLVSLALWWWIRIQRKKIFLPTLKVVAIPNSNRPTYQLKAPPWLAFVCFVLSTMALIFFSLRPTQKTWMPTGLNQEKVHIFIDLSPSVSAQNSLAHYVEELKKIWTHFHGLHRLTISTTHAQTIFEFKEFSELEQLIYTLGFHREGIHIGSAVHAQREKIGKIDKLLVLSDKDQASWSHFNWKYLLDETQVFWYEVTPDNPNAENIFFKDVHFLPQLSPSELEWNVEIERRGVMSSSRRGVLKLTYQEELLQSQPWEFPAGKNTLLIRVSIPMFKVASLKRNLEEPLVWRLDSVEYDVMKMDNEFRSFFSNLKEHVLISGGTGAESFLDSPSYSFMTSLEVLGFIPHRLDGLSKHYLDYSYPLWFMWVSQSQSEEDFCPSQWAIETLERSMDQDELKAKSFPHIWLIPEEGNPKEWQMICSCYRSLLLAPARLGQQDYCADIDSRNAFHEVFRALGARQVGGVASDSRLAIAWRNQDERSKLDITAFSMALRPSLRAGLNHSDFLIVVKDLLKWEGFISPQEQWQSADSWPRIYDKSQTEEWKNQKTEIEKKISSNIPQQESFLLPMSSNQMPPRFYFYNDGQNSAHSSKEEKTDPLPLIKLMALTLLGLMLIESLGSGILTYYRLRSSSKVLFTLWIMASLTSSYKAHAEVKLPYLSTQLKDAQQSFIKVSQTVNQRTSLELAKELTFYTSFSDQVLDEPWLWLDSTASVIDKDGRLLKKPALWIKKGGFLIVEGSYQEMAQDTLVSPLKSSAHGKWQPIPLDHELMRSFYLLNSLPSCQQQVWSGYIYDGRLAILMIPYKFMASLLDQTLSDTLCGHNVAWENRIRIFINTIMTVLTTDYKKDQIHMREILKRLN